MTAAAAAVGGEPRATGFVMTHLRRIVSGGQAGVDRAALDAAPLLGLERGGWVPKGRIAEDGVIPGRYENLEETESENPDVRTELNVRDSDATLVVVRGVPTGGTRLTLEVAARLGKPVLRLDPGLEPPSAAARRLRRWLGQVRPAVLNVAGPRRSEDETLYEATKLVLLAALSLRG